MYEDKDRMNQENSYGEQLPGQPGQFSGQPVQSEQASGQPVQPEQASRQFYGHYYYQDNRQSEGYGQSGAAQSSAAGQGYTGWNDNNEEGSQNRPPYGTWYRDMERGTGNSGKRKKEKKQKGKAFHFFQKAVAAIMIGVLFGVSAGVSFYAVDSISGMKDSRETEGKVQEAAKLQEADELEQAVQDAIDKKSADSTKLQGITGVADVVEDVMPAMVSITNTSVQTSYFFGQAIEQEATGGGSGIIIGQNDTELLVVTNYHVINNARELKVQFIDEQVADAKVKGKNASMDLAVLAVSLDSLEQSTKDSIEIATMGDSDSLKIGEAVIAIGNALGYGQSVTVGVVSALDRQIQVSDADSIGSGNRLIQTDAAINPGNSGGALLNSKGEVIGINSNKIGGEVVEGMGYAIPISSVKDTIEGMMNKETRDVVAEADRGYLGITGLNVTSDVSEMYNMPQGFYVGMVYEGGAAAAAGIVKGDIIVDVDGTQITSYEDLQDALSYYAIGDTISVTVMQGSPEGYQSKVVEVTLAAQVAQ